MSLDPLLGNQFREIFKRSIVGLFRVFREKAARQLPFLQMIGHTITAHPFAGTRFIGASAHSNIVFFFTVHRHPSKREVQTKFCLKFYRISDMMKRGNVLQSSTLTTRPPRPDAEGRLYSLKNQNRMVISGRLIMGFQRGTVSQRVLNDLKKRSSIGMIFYLILSVICVTDGRFYQRHSTLSAVFLSSVILVCAFRFVHLFAAKKMGERYAEINKTIFFASVLITALIWGGMGAAVWCLKDEPATQLLMTVCLCGLCAGGVVAFIPYRRLSISFNIAMLLPLIIVLVANRNFPLAGMVLLFSIYLSIISGRGSGEYWDALENEYLLEMKSLELTRLSNTDVLTGLFNRRYFDLMLDAEWKRSGRNHSLLSVILFDLDHFKMINDTCGHQIGDEYLKKTAEILSSVFKRETDVVARFGGEEFIVLLPGIPAQDAAGLAEKVRTGVESLSVVHERKKIKTTISGGIASGVADFNVLAESLISAADRALYCAKKSGRNRIVIFTPCKKSADA